MYRALTFGIVKQAFLFIFSMFLINSAQLYAGDDDFETEGFIQSIGEDSLVVNGFIFNVDSETEIIDDDTGDISFSDLQAGDFVEVEGQSIGNGRFYAEEIEREMLGDDDDDRDNTELETEGLISEIGNAHILVNGYTFIVTGSTEIKARHGLHISFSDLKTGMNVRVEGFWQADTILIAEKIILRELDGDDDDQEIEFTGRIDSVLNSAIAINHHIIKVNNGTLIELRHVLLGTLDDLHAGMLVEVKAVVFESVLTAIRIKVKNDDENEIEITGTIDSVGNDFIQLLGYNISIDGHTEIINHNHDSLSIANLEKGLRVKVKGSLIADHTIHARTIKIKRFHEQEIEFTGAITFIGDNQIQVEQTLFFTDSLTTIFDNHKNPITLDQLLIGQIVEIKGRLRKDGNLWAVRIKIEDRNKDEIEFTGTIEKLSADSITVNDLAFFVDSSTNVLGLQGNPISFGELNVGDLVEIKGEIQLDGSFRAVKIRLENTPGLIVVIGTITAISNDRIWINGPQYQLTDRSVILDNNYNLTDLSQYQTGIEVTLWAIETINGSPELLQSKIGTSSVTGIVNAGQSQIQPEMFELKNNYPNPFNPETTISFNINYDGFRIVKLDVFDITGRKVRTLFNGLLNAGNYSFKWNARNDLEISAASGMYIYRLSAGTHVMSRKMTLIR